MSTTSTARMKANSTHSEVSKKGSTTTSSPVNEAEALLPTGSGLSSYSAVAVIVCSLLWSGTL